MTKQPFFWVGLVLTIAAACYGVYLVVKKRTDSRLSSKPATPGSSGSSYRNLAPEATHKTSSTLDNFTNPASVLSSTLPTTIEWGQMGWNDGTPNVFPDWYEMQWASAKSIQTVTVAGLGGTQPGNWKVGTTTEDAPYAIRDYTVEAWNGTAWNVVATITGNIKGATTHNFATPVIAQRLRVSITASTFDGWSRLTQLIVMGRDS
jgi:hypothetical protein